MRAIWQKTSTRRAPSLWEQPVSARDDSQTLSLVYGHRRGLSAAVYFGATFSRVRDPDARLREYQAEVFAKGSWTFDVL